MSLVTSYHRPTKLIVDVHAIEYNLAQLAHHKRPNDAVFAVVKANGYGHGAVEVAKIALAAGAVGCCVATIDEGIELREAGIEAPILILGVVEVAYLPLISRYRLAIPVATNEWLTAALTSELELAAPIALHIAVDTGMGRIGFTHPTDVQTAVTQILAHPLFEFEGIFTHFSTADEADQTYTKTQNEYFQTILAHLPQRPRYIHSSNTASELWQESEGNLIRYGIAMYGLNPSGDTLTAPYSLKPALSLHSQLIQVKQVPQGAKIGYGATYQARSEEWIGTIPIGYADGYIRKLQGFHVLVDGQYCEVVGRVCMDQIMVRLPYEVALNAPVVLVGKMGENEITLLDMANYIGTIHYEVACLFSERIPRIYQ